MTTKCCDLGEEICELKEKIKRVDDNIDRIMLKGEGYSMDTGQNRVSKQNSRIDGLRLYRADLQSRLDALCLRHRSAHGGSSFYGRPGW